MGFSANLTLTDVGRQALANASIGDTLQFTRYALGDGYMSAQQTEATMTTLVSYLKNIYLSEVTESSGTVTCKGILNASTLSSDLVFRELGLMANYTHSGTTTEILVAYGNSGNNADTIRTTDTILRTIEVQFTVSSAATITSNYDPTSVILRSEYETDKTAMDGRVTILEAAIQNISLPSYSNVLDFIANAKEGECVSIDYGGAEASTRSSVRITALFNDAGSGVSFGSSSTVKMFADGWGVITVGSTHHFVDLKDVIAGNTTEVTATLSTISADTVVALYDPVSKKMNYFACLASDTSAAYFILLDGASANNGQMVAHTLNGNYCDVLVADNFFCPIAEDSSSYLYSITSGIFDEANMTLTLDGEQLSSMSISSMFPMLTSVYSIKDSLIIKCSFVSVAGQHTLLIWDKSGNSSDINLMVANGVPSYGTISGMSMFTDGNAIPLQTNKGAVVYLRYYDAGSWMGTMLTPYYGSNYLNVTPMSYMDGIGNVNVGAHSYGVFADMCGSSKETWWATVGYIPGSYDMGIQTATPTTGTYSFCGSIALSYNANSNYITIYDRYFSCRIHKLIKWNGKPYAVVE